MEVSHPSQTQRATSARIMSVRAEDDDGSEVEVRMIHPFQASKVYLCPGCQQEIRKGTAHLVVVPRDAADLRRHWHRPCWERRSSRRPGNAR